MGAWVSLRLRPGVAMSRTWLWPCTPAPCLSLVMHLSTPSDPEKRKLLILSVLSELGLWGFVLQWPWPSTKVLSLLGCGKWEGLSSSVMQHGHVACLTWLDALCRLPADCPAAPLPPGPFEAARKPLWARPLAHCHWPLCRRL